MIRSNRYIGISRRIVRYTSDEWSSPDFRRNALSEARAAVVKSRGEVVIKVKDGRTLTKVASIRYVDGGTRLRHHAGSEYYR